jgi:hypothetical protein
LLDACIDGVTASLRAQTPEYGRGVAIDASDLPAYADGQRYVSKGGRERERFSDPDASWGHRSAVSTRKGGGFYGYKVHAAVCAATDLPLAWRVETARSHESSFGPPLLDAVRARGFTPETCAMDSGYDNVATYDGCEARGYRPIIPVRETPAVKRGDHKPPSCAYGEWKVLPATPFHRLRDATKGGVASLSWNTGAVGRPQRPAFSAPCRLSLAVLPEPPSSALLARR